MQYTTQRSPGTQEHPIATSVVIVGAGPTGLVAANLLGMAGIETLILERNADLSDCPKAISIDDEGLRICQAVGLADEISKHVALGIDAHYLSKQHYLAKVSPTSTRNGYPLISTFHQPTLETTLLKGLERFKCVEMRFQHNVETLTQDNEKVTLTLSTPDGVRSTITCTYLLACDGGKSPIRHMLGIAMQQPELLMRRLKHKQQEDNQGQRWLVVDTIDDDSLSTAATFFCEYTRPAVTVMAPHHIRRWEFMLRAEERDEDLLADDTIHALIRQARTLHPTMRQSIQKSVPRIVRKTVYAFHAVVAQRFRQDRIFLLGDAAHLMPPFGGQGMNSGLRDAHNLCWKIQHVLQGQAAPELLETYHAERYPHVKEMILFSSILGNLVMTTTRARAWFRDRLFTLLNALPPLREALTEMRIKPQPRYRKGFLLPITSEMQRDTRAGDTFSRRTPTRGYPTISSRAKHAQASYSRVAPCGRPSSFANALAQFEQLFKHNSKLVGAFLPQPYITTQEGQRVLLDSVLGNGFVALRLYENPKRAFEHIQDDLWQQLKVKRICVLPQETIPKAILNKECEFVSDVDGQFGNFLGHRQDIVVLVRPDRYIAGIVRTQDGYIRH